MTMALKFMQFNTTILILNNDFKKKFENCNIFLLNIGKSIMYNNV